MAAREALEFVAKSRAGGGPGSEGGPKGEVAKLVGQVRKQVGVTAVKAQARMLLERIKMLGEGSATVWERQQAREQEEQRRHAEAADTAVREGARGIHRGGQPLVGVAA